MPVTSWIQVGLSILALVMSTSNFFVILKINIAILQSKNEALIAAREDRHEMRGYFQTVFNHLENRVRENEKQIITLATRFETSDRPRLTP